MKNNFRINGAFTVPVCTVKRDSNLDSKEEAEIEDIIKAGMHKTHGNFSTNNTYIFDTKLKELKQFCEQQIKIYVEHIINPKKELDFYITQSWLNVNRPGDHHHEHSHPNSIISGVFYIATSEYDKITFSDPNIRLKERTTFELKDNNAWNSYNWSFPSSNNELILFPSWLGHRVEPNKKATIDRISLSFNTFVRGNLGIQNEATELVLK